MKKKTKLLIAGGIFVAVALVAMLLFVFFGGRGSEPSVEPPVVLSGTWNVVTTNQGGGMVFSGQEYFVFTEGEAKAFREGEAEPYANSTYTFIPGNYPNWKLDLPEVGRTYLVTAISENHIGLHENKNQGMELIRCADANPGAIPVSEELIVGEWDALRNTAEGPTQEKFEFKDGILYDYRNGSAEPTISAPYYLDDVGRVCVDDMGIQAVCYRLSENVLFLADVNSGTVWELRRPA